MRPSKLSWRSRCHGGSRAGNRGTLTRAVGLNASTCWLPGLGAVTLCAYSFHLIGSKTRPSWPVAAGNKGERGIRGRDYGDQQSGAYSKEGAPFDTSRKTSP